MRCTTRLTPGSTWATEALSPPTTHSDPAPKASAAGVSPTSMMSTPPASRGMRVTVPACGFATQTEPAPAATAPSSPPSWYSVVIAAVAGSITPTAPSVMPGSRSGPVTRVMP